MNIDVNFKIICDTYSFVNGFKRSIQKPFQYYMLSIDNMDSNTLLERELVAHKLKYVYLNNANISKNIPFSIDIKCDEKYMMVFTNSIKIDGWTSNKIKKIIPPNIYLFTLREGNYIKLTGEIRRNDGRLVGNVGWKHAIRDDQLIEFSVSFNHFNIYPSKKIVELGIGRLTSALIFFKMNYKKKLKKIDDRYLCIFDNESKTDPVIEEMTMEPIQFELIKKYGGGDLIYFTHKKKYRHDLPYMFMMKTRGNVDPNNLIDDVVSIVSKKLMTFKGQILNTITDI